MFPAKAKWIALNGLSKNKIFMQLEDVVLFEELDVSGQACCVVINRYGVKSTVAHPAEEIAMLLEKSQEELMELNLKFWKDREQWKKEIKEKTAQQVYDDTKKPDPAPPVAPP